MEEASNPEEVKRFLIGNFNTLPKDVVLILIQGLPAKETLDLCTLSLDFNKFCKKNKILENKARKYVLENAPLSEPLDNIIKQANAIKRGQTTYYTLNWDELTLESEPVVIMGPPNYFVLHRYFLIKGSPPPRGTKIYVFGMYDVNDDNINVEGHAFVSLEDIIKSKNDAFVSTLINRIAEGEEVYNFPDLETAVREIAKEKQYEEFYLHHITLP